MCPVQTMARRFKPIRSSTLLPQCTILHSPFYQHLSAPFFSNITLSPRCLPEPLAQYLTAFLMASKHLSASGT